MYVHGGAATPLLLVEAMTKHGISSKLNSVEVIQGATAGNAEYAQPNCKGACYTDRGGGKCVCRRSFVCVCLRLSVCLLARLLKNACIDLDEMLRVDRRRDMDELINF